MFTIGVSDFRNHIQKYLDLISKGEEIIITSRGKEIAKIIPTENRKDSSRQKLQQLSKTAIIGDVISPVSDDWKIY